MDVNQPEELKTVQRQIEEARNQVTLLEQESLRLRKLVIAEEYTVGELVKQKAELSEQASVLADRLYVDSSALDNITASLYKAREEAQQLEADKLTFEQDKAHVEADLKLKQNILNAAEASLRERTENLVKQQEKLEKESREFSEKVNKLKEVISIF